MRSTICAVGVAALTTVSTQRLIPLSQVSPNGRTPPMAITATADSHSYFRSGSRTKRVARCASFLFERRWPVRLRLPALPRPSRGTLRPAICCGIGCILWWGVPLSRQSDGHQGGVTAPRSSRGLISEVDARVSTGTTAALSSAARTQRDREFHFVPVADVRDAPTAV